MEGAIAAWRREADAGSTEALWRLGERHREGEGVEQSYAEDLCIPRPEDQGARDEADMRAISQQVGMRMAGLSAGDIMSSGVICVDLDTTAQEMASTMVRKSIHELVAMDEDRVVGVITALDLLAQLPEIVRAGL